MRLLRSAAVAAILSTSPAVAQPVQFSALIRGDLGYGTNPFLRPGVSRGAGTASISIQPRLVQQTALSSTSVSGLYDRDEYTNNYGKTDTLGVTLLRTDQLTQHLQSSLTAGYRTSNKATYRFGQDQLVDVPLPDDSLPDDPLNIGRRTRTANAGAQLQWQASAYDSFHGGVNVARQTSGRDRSGLGIVTSSYTSYSANGGYDRVIDARTSVGVQANVSQVRSKLYPNSRSFQPSLTAKRQVSAIWTVSGHVGLVFQTIEGPFGRSSTSVGYGANACGVYTRTRICFTADRSSQPSGYGGLRTGTSFAANVSHQLTEHSHLSLSASYTDSRSLQPLSPLIGRRVRSGNASVDYDRDLTERISVGAGGRYQTRDTARIGSANALSATVHVAAKLGRI